jgi:hypothetical protein
MKRVAYVSFFSLLFFSPTHCNKDKKSSSKKALKFRQEQPIKGSDSKRIKQLVQYQDQQNKKFYILICFVQQKQDGQIS